MKYFKRRKYVKYSEGDIVLFYKKQGWGAFYEIIRIKRPYGDYAEWDDGKNYWLKLHHLEKLNPSKISGGKDL